MQKSRKNHYNKIPVIPCNYHIQYRQMLQLRHKFYPPYGGLNLCGGAGEWTHLQPTVAKGSHDSWQEQVRMHAVRALRVVSKANKSLTIRQIKIFKKIAKGVFLFYFSFCFIIIYRAKEILWNILIFMTNI